LVKVRLEGDLPSGLSLLVRIPGWARGEAVPSDLYRFLDSTEEKVSLRVNGRDISIDLENGYARIRRGWKAGDTVELALPMPVREVVAHPSVAADAGRVALQRGPLVYCVEGVDNGGHVRNLALPDSSIFTSGFRPDLLNGVAAITGRGIMTDESAPQSKRTREEPFIAVPYYAWANRGAGEMAVWLRLK
jgi:DUF1680 family protein